MTTQRTPPGGRNIVFHGNATNVVANVGNQNVVMVRQEETQTRHGPELVELLELIDRLQRQLPEVGLDRYRQEAIGKDLEQARALAADPEAPKDLLHEALESVGRKLKAALHLGGLVEQMVPWAEKAGELAARIGS